MSQYLITISIAEKIGDTYEHKEVVATVEPFGTLGLAYMAAVALAECGERTNRRIPKKHKSSDNGNDANQRQRRRPVARHYD